MIRLRLIQLEQKRNVVEHSYLPEPPKFNGKAGESFLIWEMKFKAYAQEKSLAAALQPSFDKMLLSKETDVLDDTIPAEKLQKEALVKNAKAINMMKSAFDQKKDMNKIMNEQRFAQIGWPTGKAYKV